MTNSIPSYEFIRTALNSIDKFEMKAAMLGELFASQSVREVGRLHTYYPGNRTEYDYTKFGLFLFPNETWNEPVLYSDGFGVDAHSTVIKGACLSQSPAARDTIRLVKSCVLPKSLTLPPKLQHMAQEWDVFGIERIAAMDNGMELIANAVALVFMMLGIIVVRVPPKRGDLKGTVERTNRTAETQFVSTLDGYVPASEKGMNPKYSRMRAGAMRKAKFTVEQYVEMRSQWVLEFNHIRHPRLPISRIQVWRNGQEQSPAILPTGRIQLKCLFALTYTPMLLREGVTVDNLKYNSPELFAAFLVYTGRVIVKLDPDDIRFVLVFVPKFDAPILAVCTTFTFDHPLPQELWAVTLKRIESQFPNASEADQISFVLPQVIRDLQTMVEPTTPGTTGRKDVQAATQAAALPVVKPVPMPTPSGSLKSLLGGADI
jgi:hypothetical protein